MRGTMGAGAVVTRMAASVAHQTVEYARPALTEKEITEREVAGRVVADREVAEGDRSGGSLYKEGPVGPAGTSGGGADPGLAQLLSSFQAQRDEVLVDPSRSAASLQQIAFSWAAATTAAAAATDQLAAELLAADLPPPPRPQRSLQTPPSADGGRLSSLQGPPELSGDAKAWSSLSQLLQSLQARWGLGRLGLGVMRAGVCWGTGRLHGGGPYPPALSAIGIPLPFSVPSKSSPACCVWLPHPAGGWT